MRCLAVMRPPPPNPQFTRRGGSMSDKLQNHYLPPRSGAAAGSAGRYFVRVSVTFANGDGFPDLSTLSIVHDHVSLARSYAKVVWMPPPSASLKTNGIRSPSGFAWPTPSAAKLVAAVL